jgi:methionyl-tRNA formyltransferase
MSPLTVVFAGTPEFSVPALNALVHSHHHVLAVYTQPDRPAGRGQTVQASAVKQRAQQLGIPVEQPKSLKSDDAIIKLKSTQFDIMVVVAYGLILPPAVLGVPRLGCLNIHASLLPRWRGAAPIHRALLAGDAETGVSIMKMEAGLDTGPVYLERRVPITERETTQPLHDRLADLGALALLEVMDGLPDLLPIAQPDAGATYARKLDKAEARLDWSRSAVVLDREIRAFNPWPVSETQWEGRQLRIWEAHPEVRSHQALPGTVISANAEGIKVATGDGVLSITRLQLAGRKQSSAREFLNGQQLLGARLGGGS